MEVDLKTWKSRKHAFNIFGSTQVETKTILKI
jgi:hypothetical protein